MSYVECHGTGTPLGDPIEVEALAQAYGAGRTTPLRIGSVKTNVGHGECAAGITGLIKAALCVSNGEIPASLNHRAPNPRIAWDRLPVVVNTQRTPFEPTRAPRRAEIKAPSSRRKAPATTAAATSPWLCPMTASGLSPRARHIAAKATFMANSVGCTTSTRSKNRSSSLWSASRKLQPT